MSALENEVSQNTVFQGVSEELIERMMQRLPGAKHLVILTTQTWRWSSPHTPDLGRR
jgi:hypothetical protein